MMKLINNSGGIPSKVQVGDKGLDGCVVPLTVREILDEEIARKLA